MAIKKNHHKKIKRGKKAAKEAAKAAEKAKLAEAVEAAAAAEKAKEKKAKTAKPPVPSIVADEASDDDDATDDDADEEETDESEDGDEDGGGDDEDGDEDGDESDDDDEDESEDGDEDDGDDEDGDEESDDADSDGDGDDEEAPPKKKRAYKRSNAPWKDKQGKRFDRLLKSLDKIDRIIGAAKPPGISAEGVHSANLQMVAAKAALDALPADWKPARGSSPGTGKKIGIGSTIKVSDKLEGDDLKIYKVIPQALFVGAVVVMDDGRNWVVRCTDKAVRSLRKKHAVLAA